MGFTRVCPPFGVLTQKVVTISFFFSFLPLPSLPPDTGKSPSTIWFFFPHLWCFGFSYSFCQDIPHYAAATPMQLTFLMTLVEQHGCCSFLSIVKSSPPGNHHVYLACPGVSVFNPNKIIHMFLLGPFLNSTINETKNSKKRSKFSWSHWHTAIQTVIETEWKGGKEGGRKKGRKKRRKKRRRGKIK